MTIEPISEIEIPPRAEPDDKLLLEYYGKFATTLALIIAIGAAAPAPFKKKRTYTHQITPYATPLPSPSTSATDFLAISDTPRVPTCTLQDQERIRELFTTVASQTLGLVFKQSHLESLGNSVRHLHPFTFILALPKEAIVQILNSKNPFKINNLLNGIKEGIQREQQKNNIDRYLKDFAGKMGKRSKTIKSYIANKNWRGLVHYLFSESAEV